MAGSVGALKEWHRQLLDKVKLQESWRIRHGKIQTVCSRDCAEARVNSPHVSQIMRHSHRMMACCGRGHTLSRAWARVCAPREHSCEACSGIYAMAVLCAPQPVRCPGRACAGIALHLAEPRHATGASRAGQGAHAKQCSCIAVPSADAQPCLHAHLVAPGAHDVASALGDGVVLLVQLHVAQREA